jgi:L-alanine-DL-glutamate epimerase-like enolase superfamily enzyme
MNRLRSLDVYQPDVVLSGGITMVIKIAEQVQKRGAWFSPHTWTNGIGLMANLHLACAVGKCPYLEFPFDPPAWTLERRDYMLQVQDRLMIDGDGYVHVPDKPGLGCELDEKALSKYEI